MSDEPNFTMSQDYEVIPPQKKRAYPILIEEWEHLKVKIGKIHDNANFYHTIGSILLGISGSALVAVLTLQIPQKVEGQMPVEVMAGWFIFICAGICGVLALYFGKTQRGIQNSNKDEVIEHMELIEKRYETKT